MYWYPFRDIGGVKNANLDAAVNLEVADGSAHVGFYTTSAYPAATVMLKAGSKVLLEENVAINPAKPFVKQVPVPAGTDEHDLRASISAGGKELVSYSPIRLVPEPRPKAVTPPLAPADIKTNEELLLAGQRLEQFHSAALDPFPYWEEALRRDPGDARVNTDMGIAYLKQARYAEAERYLRRAVARLTDKYTTPKDAESTYYLGVALKGEGKLDEAFDTFYKAAWNAAWTGSAYYSLAEIATQRGDMEDALNYTNRALENNARNLRALNLKAALLRHLERPQEAIAVLASIEKLADPLDARTMAERWLAEKTPETARKLTDTLNNYPPDAQETAAEYLDAGLWQDGAAVLSQAVEAAPDKAKLSPMVYYYLGYFADRMGQKQKAAGYDQIARKLSPDYVFPFQNEAIDVLRAAMETDPNDARAPYYLGNLLFDWQPEEAAKMWEKSVALDDNFAIAHRNLALFYWHRESGPELGKAIAELEKAVSLDRKYAMHFDELDELYEAAGTAPEKRLAVLERNQAIVVERPDAEARLIDLKIFAGKYDDAIQLLGSRRFDTWEGGSQFDVAGSWTDAHLLRGRQRLAARQYREALDDFQTAEKLPENLQGDQRGGAAARAAEIQYWIGSAYDAMGNRERANQAWKQASAATPAQRRYARFGDPSARGLQLYYQGLALQRLGENVRAGEIFSDLVKQASDVEPGDSAPAESSSSLEARGRQRDRAAAAHYTAALGHLGLNQEADARRELEATLKLNPAHLGARTAMAAVANKTTARR